MKNKDINALVIIWLLGFVLAALTGYVVLKMGATEAQLISPTPETATTSWLTQPATTLAQQAQRNTAWTVAIIFPFLFAPILTLIYITFRFGRNQNPHAAHFHENIPLEVFWTITPALFLVAMGVPAYRVLLYMEREPEKADVYVDVVGAQFYWQYNFPRYEVTVTDDGTGAEPLVIPVSKNIALRGTSNQVNHAWWVPAFGVKFDVIPGRINSGWIHPLKEGFFKGQCAELCGVNHARMFIHVKVVPERDFYQWLREKGAVFPPDEVQRIERILGESLAAPQDTAASTTTLLSVPATSI